MLNGVCWKQHVIVKWYLIKTTCRMCIQRSMRYMKHNRYMYIYVIQRWLQRYTVLMYKKGNSYLHAPATTKNQYPYLHWNWISHRWCWTLYRCTCKLIFHPLFSIKNDRISKVCVVRTQTGQYRYKFHSHCLVTQVVRAQAVPNGG